MCAFSTLMPLPQKSLLGHTLQKQETIKQSALEQRVRELRRVSFTSLVLSVTGGIANEATIFYKRLAPCIAIKKDQSYNSPVS